MLAVLLGVSHDARAAGEHLASGECAVTVPYQGIVDAILGEIQDECSESSGSYSYDPGDDPGETDDVITLNLRCKAIGVWHDITYKVRILGEQPVPDPHTCDGLAIEYPNIVLLDSVECDGVWCSLFEKGRCSNQQMIQNRAGLLFALPVFGSQREGPTQSTYTLRRLYRDSGGVRVYPDSVDLMIPSAAGCGTTGVCQLCFDELGPACVAFDPEHELVDFPRYVQDWIDSRTSLGIMMFGAAVACNHGVACTADRDGDGLCDGDDYCPDLFSGGNFDSDHDLLGDGMGSGCSEAPVSLEFDVGGDHYRFDRGTSTEVTVLRSCRPECDPCPDDYSPAGELQDLDGDGTPDLCDPDIDGDGTVNEWDCAPRHDGMATDLDGDGACDSYDVGGHADCEQRCDEVSAWYAAQDPPGYYPADRCRENVCVLDNCIYPDEATDDFCRNVRYYCTTGERDCAEALDGIPCAAQYGNPDQLDEDSDGVGDKCQSGVRGVTVTPGRDYVGGTVPPGGQFMCEYYGYEQIVDFHARGGSYSIADDEYNTEERTGSSVGACTCRTFDWDCVTEVCPNEGEHPESSPERIAWNPISTFPMADLATYPVAPSPDTATIEDNLLAIDRDIALTRDREESFHSFPWRWPEARQFVRGEPYILPVDYSAGLTRVRVHLQDFGQVPSYGPGEVAFSTPRELRTYQGACEGEVYLGEEFVVDLIPEIAVRPRDTLVGTRLPGQYFLGRDPASLAVHLYELGPGAMQVEAVREVLLPEAVSAAALGVASAAGILDAGLIGQAGGEVQALATYRLLLDTGGGSTHGDTLSGQLMVGSIEAGPQVVMDDLALITGEDAPVAHDARVVLLSGRQQVILIGRAAVDGPVLAWRADLAGGTWSGPRRLGVPEGLAGYAIRHDPLADRLLLFGGRTGAGGPVSGPVSAPVETGELWSVDLVSLQARRLETSGGTSGLARHLAGAHLDVAGRGLYVAGGLRGDQILSDVWRLDLRSREWQLLAAAGAGPAPMVRPIVRRDARQGRLWVGEVAGGSTAGGLSLWVTDPEGGWHLGQRAILPSPASFPVTSTHIPGQQSLHLWPTTSSTGWPGELLLARIASDSGGLGVRAMGRAGTTWNLSRPGPGGAGEAGLLCLPGETCALFAEPRPGATGSLYEAYTLDVVPATVAAEQSLPMRGQVRDLVQHGGTLVAALGPSGLVLLDEANLAERGRVQGRDLGGAEAVASCLGHLCVARAGARGLSVVDTFDPAAPVVTGTARTGGRAHDLAVRGARVFLAQGRNGVGIYEVWNPADPVAVGEISPGGRVVSVAAEQDLLAAATRSGEIALYDVGSGEPLLEDTLQSGGEISRVRFRGGRLWVLDGQEREVAVWEVLSGAGPVHLGTFGGSAQGSGRGQGGSASDGGEAALQAAPLFRALWQGPRLVTFGGPRLEVLGVRAMLQ